MLDYGKNVLIKQMRRDNFFFMGKDFRAHCNQYNIYLNLICYQGMFTLFYLHVYCSHLALMFFFHRNGLRVCCVP